MISGMANASACTPAHCATLSQRQKGGQRWRELGAAGVVGAPEKRDSPASHHTAQLEPGELDARQVFDQSPFRITAHEP